MEQLPYLVQHIDLLLSNISPILPRMKLSIIIQLGIAPLAQWKLSTINKTRRHLAPSILKVGFELFKHVHPVIFTGFPVKPKSVDGIEGEITIIVLARVNFRSPNTI